VRDGRDRLLMPGLVDWLAVALEAERSALGRQKLVKRLKLLLFHHGY
jgi:hypothetical protein